MTREDQISSPKGAKSKDYKKFTEEKEDEYKRYCSKIEMFPVNDKPKPYDQYEDLTSYSKRFLKIVKPSMKEIQQKLDNYTPKPFGERRTYKQDWSSYNKAQMKEKIILIK